MVAVASLLSGALSSQPLTRGVYLSVIRLPLFNLMLFRSTSYYDQWSELFLTSQNGPDGVLDWLYPKRGRPDCVDREYTGNTSPGEKFESIKRIKHGTFPTKLEARNDSRSRIFTLQWIFHGNSSTRVRCAGLKGWNMWLALPVLKQRPPSGIGGLYNKVGLRTFLFSA